MKINFFLVASVSAIMPLVGVTMAMGQIVGEGVRAVAPGPIGAAAFPGPSQAGALSLSGEATPLVPTNAQAPARLASPVLALDRGQEAPILIQLLESPDLTLGQLRGLTAGLILAKASLSADSQMEAAVDAAVQKAKAMEAKALEVSIRRTAAELDQDQAMAKAANLSDFLSAAMISDPEQVKTAAGEIESFASQRPQDAAVQARLTRSLIDAFPKNGNSVEQAQALVGAIDRLAERGGYRDSQFLEGALQGMMDHAYSAGKLAYVHRVAEVVDKIGRGSSDPRIRGLAYALITREAKQATKNEEYKAKLEMIASGITKASGGLNMMAVPYVEPVPGKIALKNESEQKFSDIAGRTISKTKAVVVRVARWIGDKSVGASLRWLQTLKSGGAKNPVDGFLGMALLVADAIALSFTSMPLWGILALAALTLDVYHEAFSLRDDSNQIAAFFQSCLLGALFIAAAHNASLGFFALSGLIAAGFVMRTVANWSFRVDQATAGWFYNVLIGGLSLFALLGSKFFQ